MGKKVNFGTNSKNKKKLKLFLIILVIIAVSYIFLKSVISAYKSIPKTNSQNKESYFEVSKYSSLESLLSNYNCSYIRRSTTSDRTKIYVTFDRNLYTGETSNEDYFFKIARVVAEYEKFINFELIDTSKDINIEVLCENQSIIQYSINGDKNYYLNHDSDINSKKQLANVTEFTIQSKELQELIDSNWSDSNINFGTRESTCNGYNIYFDEGIKYKKVGRKVFNLIFTEKYTGEVAGGLSVSSNADEVESALGAPSFKKNEDIYGYLGKNNYLFFDFINNQVSIYPVQKLTNELKFNEAINKMNENSDIKTFANELTDLWNDYDIYEYDSNYVNLQYTLLGIKLNISSNSLKNGIYIYQNYSGDRNIQNLENVYIESEDLVFKKECERAVGESIVGDGDYDESMSSKFIVIGRTALSYGENGIKGPTFYSLDEEYPDSELDRGILISSYLWFDDYNIIYSVDNDGIYVYNCATRENSKLEDITGNITINSIENNKIIYNDNKEVVIKIR